MTTTPARAAPPAHACAEGVRERLLERLCPVIERHVLPAVLDAVGAGAGDYVARLGGAAAAAAETRDIVHALARRMDELERRTERELRSMGERHEQLAKTNSSLRAELDRLGRAVRKV